MKNKLEINELVEHFFRHESGKLMAMLTRFFGPHNLLLVEDIVQDTLIEAISNWTYKGIPENHVNWLYTVAKNKALNVIKREKYQEKYIFENLHDAKIHQQIDPATIDLFSEESIVDDQLRMMFMCCHPSISQDSQVALILKTLCGFSISEIAKAFLTNNENINKRLVRARKAIRENKIPFSVPSKQQIDLRVDAVLEAIYLLFNEGYSASNGDDVIRKDLCQESIYLAEIIATHKFISNKSKPYSLLALMQLNAARFKAREDENGDIITLSEQDRTLWDYQMIGEGFSNLEKAAQNKVFSKYHILAAISAYHCSAADFESTNWGNILSLYESLLTIDNSPIVILNYSIVLAKTGKIIEALAELGAIEDQREMKSNHLFYATKTEFQIALKQYDLAKGTLKKAIALAPLSKEKRLLKNRFTTYFNKK
ncbi:MAG: sigma-70 family RNA polymerase sigma factor [Chitinophagales bacterium]|nr:sigma-70 family RNA polymerase sigma factor [Chitinophagales bacterium]